MRAPSSITYSSPLSYKRRMKKAAAAKEAAAAASAQE